ncbi:MAG: M48 family metalloprotease [Phycisphaerae bacterium]
MSRTSGGGAVAPAALLSGEIARRGTSPVYTLSLLLVSIAMVLLPLVYLAIVAAVGYGLYWHAVNDATVFQHVRGARGVKLAAALYIGPLLGGGLLLLFMIKPLFAPRSREFDGLPVRREDQPLLFEYVEHLCRMVGAPAPREIALNCDVNAYASFRRGFWSFLGRDLRLTIGLPLVAGLTLRQFTGVLAHEFGHFAQGLGMRLRYVIVTINQWFSRLVYERDQWDEWLGTVSESGGFYGQVFVWLAKLLIWITRGILWCLMQIGLFLTFFLARQMEYDADSYEAAVAGDDTFEKTVYRLAELNMASQTAHQQLGAAWRDRRLADNLVGLISHRARSIPPDATADIRKTIESTPTALLATHPADRDRIASVKRSPSGGVQIADGPATQLFDQFDKVCKTMTFVYYRDRIGEEVTPANLTSTELLVDQHEQRVRESAALSGYLCLDVSDVRPFVVSSIELESTAPPKDLAAAARAAVSRVRSLAPAAKDAYAKLSAAEDRLATLEAAEMLCRGKVQLQPKQVGLAKWSVAEIESARTQVRREMHPILDTVRAYEDAVSERLAAELRLLRLPAVAKQVPSAPKLIETAEKIWRALVHLQPVLEFRVQVLQAIRCLMWVGEISERGGVTEELAASLTIRIKDIAETANNLRRDLRDVDYPFEHAQRGITLGPYLLAHPILGNDPSVVLQAGQQMIEQLHALQSRGMTRLVYVASRLEESQRARREARTNEAELPSA